MSNICLVTGANGHLGNNLVRTLLSKGETVLAGVRNTEMHEPFQGLDCKLVYTEMTDQDAMLTALHGVNVLYHVAAVFKHWAKNPETDIVQKNIQGTETVLRAAALTGVKKVIYVSSVAAVGHNGQALNEQHWNAESDNAYYRSKIMSERRAWELAEELNLNMVSVLPSAMIGPNAENLTDTMSFLESIRRKELPFDPNFIFNFVDVRDVAEGMFQAYKKGIAGERYILANSGASSLREIVDAVNKDNRSLSVPKKASRWMLHVIAWFAEIGAKFTGVPAALIKSQIDLFYGVRQEYDISKARTELAYEPRSPADALSDALEYLDSRAA